MISACSVVSFMTFMEYTWHFLIIREGRIHRFDLRKGCEHNGLGVCVCVGKDVFFGSRVVNIPPKCAIDAKAG